MTTMTDIVRYLIVAPDDEVWEIAVDGSQVMYSNGQGNLFYWNDEDEVVEAIESGLISDEWITDHNDWEV